MGVGGGLGAGEVVIVGVFVAEVEGVIGVLEVVRMLGVIVDVRMVGMVVRMLVRMLGVIGMLGVGMRMLGVLVVRMLGVRTVGIELPS